MKPSKSRVSPEALAKWRFSLLILLYSTLLLYILLLYLPNIYIFIFLYSAILYTLHSIHNTYIHT